MNNTFYRNLIISSVFTLLMLISDFFGYYDGLYEMLMQTDGDEPLAILFICVAFLAPFILSIAIGMSIANSVGLKDTTK